MLRHEVVDGAQTARDPGHSAGDGCFRCPDQRCESMATFSYKFGKLEFKGGKEKDDNASPAPSEN